MTWQTTLLEIDGKRTLSMIDSRFADNPLVEQLPHLAWFGVFCRLNPGASFWDPKEGAALDAIENELIRLCEVHGNGWAAYVQCLHTPGLREYYVYFGEGACLENVLPALKSANPEYRLEYDRVDDLKWAQYAKWLRWVASAKNLRPRPCPRPGLFSFIHKLIRRGS